MTKLFALVDCNNFYASCERVFRPDLEGKPIVVLSNNDGCIVARSNEVKALGVAMASPYFKNRDLLRRHGVHVFSSNYELYADLSARVMTVLSGFSPEVEVYSIDEAFLSMDGQQDLDTYARTLRTQVKRWTGIPVSVGIAPTKTLAKLAGERAKKDAPHGGVLALSTQGAVQDALARTQVGDVWGVGRRWAKRFEALGITTALDFTRQDEHWVRSKMGVTGARTHAELLGRACFALESQPQARQSCVASRSFAAPVTDLIELQDAVATFAARAGERLRAGGLVAGQVNTFVLTDRFKAEDAGFDGTATVALASPSNLTADITRAALEALRRAYRAGGRYKKAGVMLMELSPEGHAQQTLFAAPAGDQDKAQRLQQAMDAVNGGHHGGQSGGRDLVRLGAFAGAPRTKGWHLRRDNRSPRYTTQWAELKGVG